MILIECLGVPASGKSTVANEVFHRLDSMGLNVRYEYDDSFELKPRAIRSVRKAWYIAKLTILAPSTVLNIISLVGSTGQNIKNHIRIVQHALYLEALYLHWSNKCDVLIFHQAFMQLIYSMVYSGTPSSTENINRLYRKSLKADIYIYILVDPATAIERLKKRDKPGSSLESNPEMLSSNLKDSFEIIENVISHLERDGRELYKYKYPSESDLNNEVRSISDWVVSTINRRNT